MDEDSARTGRPLPSWQRPFFGRTDPGSHEPSSPPDETAAVSGLRPYMLTAGRAQPVDTTLEIEAQVLTSDLGLASQYSLAFEHRDIIALCTTTMSVAEVGAKLRLHIGVARVLVADLAELGYLEVRRPNTGMSQDLNMIERVIRGLEAIR
jgi:hypothetical protein